MSKCKLTAGILAHVDSGKTTLAESILFQTGKIRKLGRVDHGDAYLDNYELEQSRGITIFSKQAEIMLGDRPVTLLDTPGHVDFAAEMKLAREQVRAKNKETLLGIVNSTTLTDEQKQAAVDEMISLTDIAEREAAAEMLLEAKGFTDVVVSITDNAVDVVLDMGDVTDAKRAQIEDIVKRKTNISAENIIITPIETAAGAESENTEENSTEQDSTQTQNQTEQ